jgi:hypothetical protein
MEMWDQNGQLPMIFMRLKNPYVFIGRARDPRFPKNPLLGRVNLLWTIIGALRGKITSPLFIARAEDS